MEFLAPRAREEQRLPAWVRRAAHWQGRAGKAAPHLRFIKKSRRAVED
jgi:hypothetical protein